MPSNKLYITTSWDDGHPSDLRLAELLIRYKLKATFYVPLHNDRELLTKTQLRTLSQDFEIGGHTLHHCDLRRCSNSIAEREIVECKVALEDITSRPCRSFCFPMGRFGRSHLNHVRKAGFSLARTVELMSLQPPRFFDGLAVMPTTLQAVPARSSAYLKNGLKRLRPRNIWRYAQHCRPTWAGIVESILEEALQRGGVLHLWGHSWEIDKFSDWKDVEHAFSLLAQVEKHATFVSNGELLSRLKRVSTE